MVGLAAFSDRGAWEFEQDFCSTPRRAATDSRPLVLRTAHASRHSRLLPFPLLHGKSHFGDDRWDGHIRTGCGNGECVSSSRRHDRGWWRWRCAAPAASDESYVSARKEITSA